MKRLLMAVLFALVPTVACAHITTVACTSHTAHEDMRLAVRTLDRQTSMHWMHYVSTMATPNLTSSNNRLVCYVTVTVHEHGVALNEVKLIHIRKLSHGRGYYIWANH